MTVRWLTRTALFLSLTLLFQSLRFIIPLPPVTSIFVVGTLVNACLITATLSTGFYSGVLIAVIAPLVAFFQQLLPIPLLIVPIAIGNLLLVAIFSFFKRCQFWIPVIAAALGKTIFLYTSTTWLLTNFITLPSKASSVLLFAMSWPQGITAIAGGIVAYLIINRLIKSPENFIFRQDP
jgi:hypothetical protein